MSDRELRREALSAILGFTVKFHKDSQQNKLTGAQQSLLRPHDIIHIIWRKASLEHFLSKETNELPLSFARGTRTEAEAIRKGLIVNEEDFFDPPYDYDFTHIKDAATYKRGGERYSRPYGWMRIALKVLGKYEDGDGWLGTGASAWPVSYHGTSNGGATGIIRSHYIAGSREACGRGIYSTPHVDDALGYSTRFKSESTKKTYDVILQNRINPKNREIKVHDYWLVPIPEGASKDEEEKISENSIRPYGLLLREV